MPFYYCLLRPLSGIWLDSQNFFRDPELTKIWDTDPGSFISNHIRPTHEGDIDSTIPIKHSEATIILRYSQSPIRFGIHLRLNLAID